MNPFIKKYHPTLGTHCWYCENEFNGASVKRTRDHIVPISRIEQNHPKNYVAACRVCNSLKSNKNAKEFAIYAGRLLFNCYEESVKKRFGMINKRAWKLYNKTSKLHKIFYK